LYTFTLISLFRCKEIENARCFSENPEREILDPNATPTDDEEESWASARSNQSQAAVNVEENKLNEKDKVISPSFR